MRRSRHAPKGFTLIESLVGVAVFTIVAVSVYQAYSASLGASRTARMRLAAVALANEQFEIIRNLPYGDVGVAGGLPPGKIPRVQNLVRGGYPFTVDTAIRDRDDPFDGTLGGTPNDLSPADYRLAELKISCPSCPNFRPLTFTTYVAPRSLETASANGALFLRVFDAVGQPVPGADIHIENRQSNPTITVDETTNNEGMLQIVDAPPGAEAYEITVSKAGYSSERTYPTGAPVNPNPVKPHATVILQQLTQISFAIDRVSAVDVSSVGAACGGAGAVDFSLEGAKFIGTNPDVPRYRASHVTDNFGRTTIPGLEWDAYRLTLADETYDLAGSIPLLPLSLNPGANQDVKLVVAPKNPRSLLVTVRDASTRLPLSDAAVRLSGAGVDSTRTTGRGFLAQTDWSGGAGQEDFSDPAHYSSSDGNIETADPAGEIRLRKIFGEYVPSAFLISSTFDTGSAANFHQILWQPQDQPPAAGQGSVRLQIATNNDRATWNFTGPDGTAGSSYTSSDQNLNPLHNGYRYLRYKVFLRTASATSTPIVSDVSFTFTSSCVPPGQVLFSGLSAGDYALAVSKSGYQPLSDTVSVSAPWQEREGVLSPSAP